MTLDAQRDDIVMKLLAIGFILVNATPQLELRATFPGHPEVSEPTGRYKLVFEEAGQGTPHELVLVTLATGQATRLISFNRRADVLWGPDGNALAITSWDGSDFSELFVVQMDDPSHLVNVAQQLQESFGPMPELVDNHHVYFEALSWIDPRVLRFKVSGHGANNPDGFELFFESDLHGPVRKAPA